MRVFVLCTGRCGSVTFSKAARHITNFTSGHETRAALAGPSRLVYPDRHIEADNRLSWFLGTLDAMYGKNAFYVHLQRNAVEVAASFAKRLDGGIMKAFANGVIMRDAPHPPAAHAAVCMQYVQTVSDNIRLFLRDKPMQMEFHLENAKADFAQLWQRIGAQGDLGAALGEFEQRYNASEPEKVEVRVAEHVRTQGPAKVAA